MISVKGKERTNIDTKCGDKRTIQKMSGREGYETDGRSWTIGGSHRAEDRAQRACVLTCGSSRRRHLGSRRVNRRSGTRGSDWRNVRLSLSIGRRPSGRRRRTAVRRDGRATRAARRRARATIRRATIRHRAMMMVVCRTYGKRKMCVERSR